MRKATPTQILKAPNKTLAFAIVSLAGDSSDAWRVPINGSEGRRALALYCPKEE